jgi:hypothetical protein
MSTPRGMKCIPRTLVSGDKALIYSDAHHIVLQLRHLVPSEEQLLEPSFKVGVELSAAEAIAIASDLLNAALPQLAALRAAAEVEMGTGLKEEEVDS